MMQDERLLVVSAHAADYVWRAGGTIAKYVKNGAKVHLVVLSVGVLEDPGSDRGACEGDPHGGNQEGRRDSGGSGH